MRRRSIPTVLALTTAALAFAAPALAEGSFTSSMSGWLPGNNTRDWDDKNKDNASTTFAAKQCDYDTAGVNVSSIHMELNRHDTWTPDEHYGEKKIACSPNSSVTTVGWGDKGKGEFDMSLRRIDGNTVSYKGRLNVKYVKISY